MRLHILVLLLVVCVTLPAHAQEETHERVDLRVISASPTGTVGIDRGASDGVEVGDRVIFRPRQGGVYEGTIARLNERSAEVELVDKAFVPEPGTRGEVLVPRSRLAERAAQEGEPPEPEPEAGPEVEPEAVVEAEDEPPEHPPWENQDEEWTEDMPLLAKVRALRPEDRAPLFVGRVYFIADQTFTTDEGRSDGFYRAGTDLEVENPFGLGGGFRFDGEANYRYVDVPDFDDDDDARLRLDRLSYFWGGTRYENDRLEFGRFLHYGVPEFGVVDGIEWVRRRANGHRYGASVGYLLEPDADYDTGEDFQMSAWYEWVSNAQDEIHVTTGFQKTLHNGASDRDLLVVKAEYLPPSDWDAYATAWIDFYGSGDNAKSGTEITQALATVRRRWADASANLTFRRIRFPELENPGFLVPVTPQELADARYDRLSLSGWKELENGNRLHGQIAGWDDEDDSGGDVDFGIEVEDLYLDRSIADFTLFATRGQFSFSAGGRASYGRYVDGGRWDLSYSIVDHHNDGFAHDNDDVFQHNLRASRSFYTASGWDVSIDAETNFYDGEEAAFSVGLYVQKSLGR